MRVPFTRITLGSATAPSTLADLEKNDGGNHVSNQEKPPKLLKFQTLTGICSPRLLRSDPSAFRPAPNQGIYQRTVDEEAKVKTQYEISKYIVNSGGMLQIVVGAALTALGAAAGPSAAVTILGAFNTVIAGLLTYLKGQGLPTRLEQYLHLLRTLREHIEERERELLEPDCLLDVDDELQRITRMYQEVRQTAEDNSPGTVLPPRGIITSLLKKPDINRSDVPAPRGDKNPAAMLTSGLQDLASFGHHAAHQAQAAAKDDFNKQETAMATAAEKERQHLGAEMQHLGDMAKDALHLGKKGD
ncbi:MAG: hypothetical protein Q9219_003497 [cf. Caloplaca sp. 3 TL-2023]